MKMKNIPADIKSKSINDAKSEILDILDRLEKNDVDLEGSKKDYKRLLSLNDHIDHLLKMRIKKIRLTKGKKK
tara:strand:+ start:1609 stop:1827 length:219 start_codon:yes stop_codon:yes gene_type:complete